MQVRLISKTEPYRKKAQCLAEAEYLNWEYEGVPSTTEELISYVARVSNPANQDNFDTSEKLIRYLLKKSHWSPFEMADLTVEIKTTRDIGRQILRHRSFSFQEFSQRYATADDAAVIREARLQDVANRQNSISTDDQFLQYNWGALQQKIIAVTGDVYKEALSQNIAKEQARVVLPEGLTPTTMYMKGSIRSWFHYCLVRCHPGTQKEHREIAHECWKILQNHFSFFQGLDIEKLSIRYQEMFESILEECYD